MRSLNAILSEINESLRLNLNNVSEYESLGSGTEFHTQARLYEQNERTYPLVDNGSGNGTKLSLDDTYKLQIYHRVLDSEYNENPEAGKGSKGYRFKHYMMRLVCFGDVSRLASSKTYDQNEDMALWVYQAIPEMLTSQEQILIGEEETNKQVVLDSEFEGYDTKHLRLTLVAFWIDYTVKVKADCALTQTELINYADVVGVTSNAYVIR